MNWDPAAIVASVSLLASAGAMVYARVTRRHERTERTIAEHMTTTDTRLDEISAKLASLETALGHTPGPESLRRIYTKIEGLSEKVSHMEGQHRGHQEIIRMIVQEALTRAKE